LPQTAADAPATGASAVSIVVVVAIEFVIPARILSHRVVIGLLIPNANRFSDYDNDNDNECIAFFLTRYLWL
jgi:hypothetical protein